MTEKNCPAVVLFDFTKKYSQLLFTIVFSTVTRQILNIGHSQIIFFKVYGLISFYYFFQSCLHLLTFLLTVGVLYYAELIYNWSSLRCVRPTHWGLERSRPYFMPLAFKAFHRFFYTSAHSNVYTRFIPNATEAPQHELFLDICMLQLINPSASCLQWS